MSATKSATSSMTKGEESSGGPPFDRSPDHRYFRAIERLFIELRGAPLQLSPDDFAVAKEWRADGIPLDVALATLREVASRAVEKEEDPKRRLRYYRRAVEKAWERQRELEAPGASPEARSLDLAERLGRLAAALPELPGRDELAAEINALEGSAETVEEALEDLDAELLERAEESLDDAARGELEERLEASLAALRGRLGGASEETKTRLRRELLRRVAGVPVLSLFSPEAMGVPGGEGPE